MVGGYLRDTYDWIPMILLMIVFYLLIYQGYYWYRVFKKKNEEKDINFSKHSNHYVTFTIAFLFVTIIIAIGNETRHQYLNIYQSALEYEESGHYRLAYEKFKQLEENNFEVDDLHYHIEYNYKKMEYALAIECLSDMNYLAAYNHFHEAQDYLDSEILADYCYYMYINEKYPDWYYYMNIPTLEGR